MGIGEIRKIVKNSQIDFVEKFVVICVLGVYCCMCKVFGKGLGHFENFGFCAIFLSVTRVTW